jgi:sugar-specific transcriptional regulator TrmB
MDISLLAKLGFSDRTAKIYLVLLGLGPSSVRKLAESVDLNRGMVYEALKELQDLGLVGFFKEDTKQFFVAENPEKLRDVLRKREEELGRLENRLEKMIPELQALHDREGDRPIAKYYRKKDICKILEDVLVTCEQSEKTEYRIYSAEGVREFLYEDFPTFSDVRIAKGISVRAIAIGEGGEMRGLDERKWLKGSGQMQTYIIVYPGKTAYISLDAKDEPIGVVIENAGICETQKLIFDSVWNSI